MMNRRPTTSHRLGPKSLSFSQNSGIQGLNSTGGTFNSGGAFKFGGRQVFNAKVNETGQVHPMQSTLQPISNQANCHSLQIQN